VCHSRLDACGHELSIVPLPASIAQ
jgi:hypothetical protein